jgi:starch synthase
MKVLIVAAEAVPYCKVGGLADVVGALFKELKKCVTKVYLALPFYRRLIGLQDTHTEKKTISVKLGPRQFRFEVFRHEDVYLFDCHELFGRDGIYGEDGIAYEDNPIRYAFFSRAVLEFIRETRLKVDLLHLNDWQTALVPFYLRTVYRKEPGLMDIPTVLTIHNLGYQGLAEKKLLSSLGIPEEYFTQEALEFYGRINILKAGILYSDVLTTVSPTYAQEITTKEFGYGLEGVLSQRREDLYGILNGIDNELFSPEGDPYIKAHYSSEGMKGKTLCRRALIKETNLNAEGFPVVAYVGRLVDQKGLDILIPAMQKALQWGVPFCVLGEGDHLVEETLRAMASEYKHKLFVRTAFDEPFSRRLYAGADILVVPSRYEPCGLVQMIALRYGTLPVVRKTGGLSDTVVDYNPFADEGYGFVFEEYSESALWEAMKRAFQVWLQRTRWRKLVQRAMRVDFSWQRSVEKYLTVYKKALKKRRG